MCFRPNGATTSRRRRSLRLRPTPALPPLAMLDLSKPGERQAHDFLQRATRKRNGMWKLIGISRQGDVMLCVVRWVYPYDSRKPFSLTVVSLAERAVRWSYFTDAQAAWAKMEQYGRASMTSPDPSNRRASSQIKTQ